MSNINVIVWNEARHGTKREKIQKLYPDDIHGCIAGYLGKQPGLNVRTATLDEPEHGLTQDVIDKTDVLIWWGHSAHKEVKDEVVDRVQAAVLKGMGLIVLHSGHFSKIFKRLMGTSCVLHWRNVSERERLWVVNPYHPIAAGIGPYIELPEEEMYGEFFDIPEPDELVFIGWFEGGEVFRSGATWHRGKGKIFYFQPGHDTYPIYQNPEIMTVIENAVRWAKFSGNTQVENIVVHFPNALEKIG
jgi:trehalose utilization protein